MTGHGPSWSRPGTVATTTWGLPVGRAVRLARRAWVPGAHGVGLAVPGTLVLGLSASPRGLRSAGPTNGPQLADLPGPVDRHPADADMAVRRGDWTEGRLTTTATVTGTLASMPP